MGRMVRERKVEATVEGSCLENGKNGSYSLGLLFREWKRKWKLLLGFRSKEKKMEATI